MHHSVQVDQYIIRSSPFAIPILNHLRNLIHQADARITETIKWGMPFFELKGTVCHIAAFKHHCAFGFWKGTLMTDEFGLFEDREKGMGMLGKIKSLEDLPADEILIAYVQQAIQLNEDGVKVPAKPKAKAMATEPLLIPRDFIALLEQNPRAMEVFQNFSRSNQKDYVIWFNEAKTDTTRQKRLETALEWISEGKTRMWKYKK